MEITHFQKNLDKKEQKAFLEYLKLKLPAIENLLGSFADDAAILKVGIERFDKHDAYEVEFNLTLPTKSLIAKEASHQITKAVDLCKDRLVAQIKKHIAMLRKDRKHRDVREQKAKTATMVETLL